MQLTYLSFLGKKKRATLGLIRDGYRYNYLMGSVTSLCCKEIIKPEVAEWPKILSVGVLPV